MKKAFKKVMELLLSLGGTLLGLYLCGYWLLFAPLRNLYVGYTTHTITWCLVPFGVSSIFWRDSLERMRNFKI